MKLPYILAAALLCVTASAQDKKADTKKAPAGMQMPKPAPEMKTLRSRIGTWTSEETMEPTPFTRNGGTATGTNTIRNGPGGFSVVMDHRSKGTMGPFSGHAILTWDPNEKAYKTLWVDSMTQGPTIETGHQEGDNLVYTG